MAQRRPFHQKRGKHTPRPPIQVNVEPPRTLARPVTKEYGKPFVLLEDEHKKTFEFQAGAWVEYGRSIAECRVDGLVKELSQKVNKMTRYEIRLQV